MQGILIMKAKGAISVTEQLEKTMQFFGLTPQEFYKSDCKL